MLTEQQQAFVDAVKNSRDNLALDARAGTGKTATLLEAVSQASEDRVLALAFNKSIADELRKKLPNKCKVQTFNGLGHTVWHKQIGRKPVVNQNKLYELTKEALEDFPECRRQMGNIMRVVGAAKSMGIVPQNAPGSPKPFTSRETLEELADDEDLHSAHLPVIETILLKSIQAAWEGNIDFADQIYMPSIYRGPFPRGQYDLLVVDEAQDLNPLQHLMVSKSMSKSCRLIAAGDLYQAIYGFRGALAESLEQFIKDFNMQVFPITQTFRCPHAVVQDVSEHGHVLDFEAREDNEQGEVSYLPVGEWKPSMLEPRSVVLCRTNAPLFQLAMQRLVHGHPSVVHGRDLHKNLQRVLKDNWSDNINRLKTNLENWSAKKIEEARLKGNTNKESKVRDQYECLANIVAGSESSEQVWNTLDSLFSHGKGKVVEFATIHKVKGLEWQTVYLLSPETDSKMANNSMIPHPMAKKAWEIKQEYNLEYVAQTRALKNLVYLGV